METTKESILDKMIEVAREYIKNAYAPYSNIHVASVVLGCGKLYPGVNVENASYGLTMCAERSAIFRMVTEGCRHIDKILVYSEDIKPYPCGACLQVIAEFGSPETEVLVFDGKDVEKYTLKDLLPKAFRIK